MIAVHAAERDSAGLCLGKMNRKSLWGSVRPGRDHGSAARTQAFQKPQGLLLTSSWAAYQAGHSAGVTV